MASVGDMSMRSGSSKRTSKSSKGHIVLQAVEIIHEKDREILDLRSQLERERTRADIAKEDVKEVVKRFHVLHAQKTAAVQEAAKWKAQLQCVLCMRRLFFTKIDVGIEDIWTDWIALVGT